MKAAVARLQRCVSSVVGSNPTLSANPVHYTQSTDCSIIGAAADSQLFQFNTLSNLALDDLRNWAYRVPIRPQRPDQIGIRIGAGLRRQMLSVDPFLYNISNTTSPRRNDRNTIRICLGKDHRRTILARGNEQERSLPHDAVKPGFPITGSLAYEAVDNDRVELSTCSGLAPTMCNLTACPASARRVAVATAMSPPFRSQSTPINTRWQIPEGTASSSEAASRASIFAPGNRVNTRGIGSVVPDRGLRRPLGRKQTCARSEHGCNVQLPRNLRLCPMQTRELRIIIEHQRNGRIGDVDRGHLFRHERRQRCIPDAYYNVDVLRFQFFDDIIRAPLRETALQNRSIRPADVFRTARRRN